MSGIDSNLVIGCGFISNESRGSSTYDKIAIKKTCTKCLLELDIDKFGKRKRNLDGLQSRCRQCFNEFARTSYSVKGESGWKYGRNSWYIRKYGISYEEKVSMVITQNYKCLICGSSIALDNKSHVDHDHKTGKVRGILCNKCNTGLYYVENVDFVNKAKEYLRK